MKQKLAILSGFVLGITGFLVMFKFIFLDRIPPSDELAPGIVVIAAILNGVLFAFIASRLYQYFAGRRNYKM